MRLRVISYIIAITGVVIAIGIFIINNKASNNNHLQEDIEVDHTNNSIVTGFEWNEQDNKYNKYELKYSNNQQNAYVLFKDGEKVKDIKDSSYTEEKEEFLDINHIIKEDIIVSLNNFERVNSYIYKMSKEDVVEYISRLSSEGSKVIRTIETSKFYDVYVKNLDDTYTRYSNKEDITIISSIEKLEMTDIENYMH